MGAGQVPLSMSPNGRWITNSRGGTNRGVDGLLLGSVRAQVLIEDSVITQPFWSPDGRFMAFFEGGKLKKGDVSGGPSQIVCDTPTPIGGGTWNSDGVILFSGAGVIQRVLAAGGQPTAITELDQANKESEHLAPFFLPDGRHYLFLAVAAESGIYVGSLTQRKGSVCSLRILARCMPRRDTCCSIGAVRYSPSLSTPTSRIVRRTGPRRRRCTYFGYRDKM